MNHTEKTIPVWEKYSLNVSEAAEYYGIGEKRLTQIAGENAGADFILEVGSHIRFKRKLFEDYLDTASTV
ncbi:transposase [[Ruminococcus] gnavus]|uniref:MerR family transcriptional regulator n=1 Tax=Mediterraneibacter gnavus TaxID=33038 RepID=UPI001570E3D2|nr:excisionase [Mediterraneibacter gnavus]NSD12737.1 transposase [Mediterraneibacter gnavus]